MVLRWVVVLEQVALKDRTVWPVPVRVHAVVGRTLVLWVPEVRQLAHRVVGRIVAGTVPAPLAAVLVVRRHGQLGRIQLVLPQVVAGRHDLAALAHTPANQVDQRQAQAAQRFVGQRLELVQPVPKGQRFPAGPLVFLVRLRCCRSTAAEPLHLVVLVLPVAAAFAVVAFAREDRQLAVVALADNTQSPPVPFPPQLAQGRKALRPRCADPPQVVDQSGTPSVPSPSGLGHYPTALDQQGLVRRQYPAAQRPWHLGEHSHPQRYLGQLPFLADTGFLLQTACRPLLLEFLMRPR